MKKEKIDIVYEDKYIIVVNKPSGLFTVSTDREWEKTLFHQVLVYLKQKHKSNKVFIVHRLDKDTSGLVLFAKSEKVKLKLQDNWKNVYREYFAVVNGTPDKEIDTIKSYLKETNSLLVYSSNDEINGKLAITNYKIITYNKYHVVSLKQLTYA